MTWAFFDRERFLNRVEEVDEAREAARGMDGYDDNRWEELRGCLLEHGRNNGVDITDGNPLGVGTGPVS